MLFVTEYTNAAISYTYGPGIHGFQAFSSQRGCYLNFSFKKGGPSLRILKTVGRITIVCILVLLLLAMIFLLTPLGALCSIVFEDTFTKWEINNPYVNSDFSGWKEVSLDSSDTFYIPENWSIERDGELYSILDEYGDQWAFGAIFGKGEYFHSYADVLESNFKIPPIDVILDSAQPICSINSTSLRKMIVQYEDRDAEYYRINMLGSGDKTVVLILLQDPSADEIQYDIAQALMYSFCFYPKQ